MQETNASAKGGDVLLKMEGICKEFPGVKALDNVSLAVKAGTVHALMGENGAGKSTLMKCLFGVYSKDSGDIFLEGQKVEFRNSKEALENGVAMVHQELNQALTAMYSKLKEVFFVAKKGEVLGVACLDSSGRTELLENIFGIATRKRGEIYLHGKQVMNRNARESIANKFALLTEERRATGIFAIRDIQANTTISSLQKYRYKGFPLLSDKKLAEVTEWGINAMRTKTPTQKTQICSLSGGNQQKVILARWLLTDPEVLLLDEPTRGIDVGAKYEIYQLILNLAKFKLHPFIVTLSTQLIVYGVILMYLMRGVNNGQTLSGLADNYRSFITGTLFSISGVAVPKYVLYSLILTIIMWVIWNKTTFGKNMFAVGSNEEAANVSGVNVMRTIIMVFMLAGMMDGDTVTESLTLYAGWR